MGISNIVYRHIRSDIMKGKRSCTADPMDASTWEKCSMYRGHLRLALLKCLNEKEMHGLDMINRIEEVTSGDWHPSPGSVYPILQEFEKAELVQKEERGRSVYYSITKKGKDAYKVRYNDVMKHMDLIDWVLEGRSG
jgi:DNA-binding PadR family transcriptional regulator